MADLRTIPQDSDAEMALLGALLVSEDVREDLLPTLGGNRDLFLLPARRTIFQGLLDLQEAAVPVDLLTLANRLREWGTLDEIGGHDALIELAESFADCGNARHYAEIVLRKYQLRQLVQLGIDTANGAYELDADPERLCRRVATLTDAIDAGHRQTDETADAVDHVAALKEELANPAARLIPTGLRPFDLELGGLERATSTIVAAATSVGKTSLALTAGVNVARDSNAPPVLLFSLEMPRTAIAMRVVAQIAGTSAHHLRNGLNAAADRDHAIAETTRLLRRGRLFVCDDRTRLRDILTTARGFVRRRGVGVVIVDYLQLVQPDGRQETRNLSVAAMSRSFKQLAIQTDAAVVVLSQLSRDASKTGRRPVLSDLRDSGAIEQDADVVLALHRDAKAGGEYPETVELNTLKNRNGPRPRFKLAFYRDTMKFEAARAVTEAR